MSGNGKSQRVKDVAKATLTAFDNGKRGGDLLEVFVDEVDKATGGRGPKTDIIVGILAPAALGESRSDLEKMLLGFNF
jgi:hypothetical protein